jgi:ABC-type nitrate/sulfonate/bicarbonate transport system substrate-binding protein
MRRNIGFLLGGLFLLLLAGCSPVIDEAASAEKPVSIKLCLSTSSANQLVPVVAKQAGLFAARGLDVEVLSVENGSDAAVALVTGDVDLCQMGATGVVGAVAAGVELKIVGASSTNISTACGCRRRFRRRRICAARPWPSASPVPPRTR